MRILLASLHPRPFSGQIHSLRALAGVLEKSGNDVQLRTVAAPDSGYTGRLESIVGRASAMLDLLREIARDANGADLVHLYLPTPGFSILGDWLVARVQVPVVVGFEAPLISRALARAVASEASREPLFYLPRLAINNRLLAGAARHRAAAYVVSTRYQKSQLEGLGVKAPVAVIPNVVDLGTRANESPEAARRELGLPEGAPLVGYVGHFQPVKGVDNLIQAFAKLRTRVPSARLVLAWSGLGDREAIARQLAQHDCLDSTVWLGHVRLPSLLRALDVLALPYRYPIGQNAFPNLLLEAQGMGVPLVSTRIPVIAEACQASGTAVLVPPDEPTALASALERLIDDPAARDVMIGRQRRNFGESFAPAALDWRYRDLYQQALGNVVPAGVGVALPREAA